MPAGPQPLAESFSPYPTGEFECERLVELVRWHVARIAAGALVAPDAVGSIPLGREPHAECHERNPAETVECALDARPAEDVTPAGGQFGVHEQPDHAHAVEKHTQQQ